MVLYLNPDRDTISYSTNYEGFMVVFECEWYLRRLVWENIMRIHYV